MRRKLMATCVCCVLLAPLLSCGCDPGDGVDQSQVAKLETVEISIGEHRFLAWLADDPNERSTGLMHVTAEQMAPTADGVERAMLFVFPADQSASHGFWMKDTIIPLDIAFIRREGTIVTIRTMAPLDTRTTHSTAPYRLALETRATVLKRLGIKSGDQVQIPASALNNVR